jgi:hypothetical protein
MVVGSGEGGELQGLSGQEGLIQRINARPAQQGLTVLL